MQGIFFCNSLSSFIKNITQSDYLLALFPSGFHSFPNTASNFLNIIPIVFRKFSLSLKNYGNFDLPTCLPAYRTGRPDRQAGQAGANELLEVPLIFHP